jgi:hypothetical protein
VALDGGDGFGEVATDAVGSKAGPAVVVAVGDGGDPCGFDGVAGGSMVEGDEGGDCVGGSGGCCVVGTGSVSGGAGGGNNQGGDHLVDG